MTEGDKAFYKRRMREEIRQAQIAESPQLRQLHLHWAMLYQERLDGTPRTVTRKLEARLRAADHRAEETSSSGELSRRGMLKAG